MNSSHETDILTDRIKEVLPIQATPVGELVDALQKKGHTIGLHTQLSICDVYNSKQTSGIVCVVQDETKKSFVCALTHLNVPDNQPLSNVLTAYIQQRRFLLELIGMAGVN
jgi:hypothetical protein